MVKIINYQFTKALLLALLHPFPLSLMIVAPHLQLKPIINDTLIGM